MGRVTNLSSGWVVEISFSVGKVKSSSPLLTHLADSLSLPYLELKSPNKQNG